VQELEPAVALDGIFEPFQAKQQEEKHRGEKLEERNKA
jgi:hypothetical protein